MPRRSNSNPFLTIVFNSLVFIAIAYVVFVTMYHSSRPLEETRGHKEAKGLAVPNPFRGGRGDHTNDDFLGSLARFNKSVESARNVVAHYRAKRPGSPRSSLDSSIAGQFEILEPSSSSHSSTTVDVAHGGGAEAGNTQLRDLVVGLGTGITPENLAVFAGSLRAVNPSAALVLYLDNPVPDKHREIINRYDIEAIEFTANLLTPSFLQNYHPSNYRWPLLYRYLSEHGHMYRKVILADVRDTMFQADPFLRFETGFYVFHGVETRTIGECGWNSGWIRDCFGQSMVKQVYRKPIICSGISMGDAQAVKDYLEVMKTAMETNDFAKCERNGVDQGVHNVLVHTDRLGSDLTILSSTKGWVANMQGHTRSSLKKDFKVVNKGGALVAVVHQYDRFKDLQKEYFTRFVFWNWEHEDKEQCAKFTVKPDVDLFKKRCDLSVSSGHSEGMCCTKCLAKDGCQAWTLAGSLCYLKNCRELPSTGGSGGAVMKGVTSGYLM